MTALRGGSETIEKASGNMWLQLAQFASSLNAERDDYQFDPEQYEPYPIEMSYWQWLWYSLYGWPSFLYFAFTIWMVIYCLKNDPDRYLWIWVMLIFSAFGAPVIYFFVRWLPSSNLQLPSFTKRWTKRRELRQLETASLQIGNAHQFIQYGDALRAAGKHTQASEAYLKALAKEPENLSALWGAGVTEFRLEKYKEAREHLEKILAVDESYKFGDVSLLYGKTLSTLDLKDVAREHLEKHVRKWRQPEAMYLLATLQLAANQPDKARDSLQNLIIDLDSSPRAIARKHLFWKSRARRLLRKTSNA